MRLTTGRDNYPALTVTGNTLTVSGAGEASGRITLSGSFPDNYSEISYYLTEKEDGETNWTYDDSELLDFKVFPDNESGAWFYYDVIEATDGHEYTGARPSENWTKLLDK